MRYDGALDIATGMSKTTKIWKNEKMYWSQLVEKLKEPHYTNETLKQFLKASKEDQDKIKDVGGYVGGLLRNGRRSPQNVIHRQLITLDIDFADKGFWDKFSIFRDEAALIHGTHKHRDESPRYRLIMPLDRPVTPDEYVAIARKVAGALDINVFDNTTFQTNRLMFWPSSPKDVDYYCEYQDGPWLIADKVLAAYQDWTDSSQWPTAEQAHDDIKTRADKQQDPRDKKGIIGAFCRSFTIQEAIDEFLSEEYDPVEGGRFTYKKGSTAGGLIVYDDIFAYSHHGTDPCSGLLCNAFDLVRVHRFGSLDEGNRTSSRSTKAMEELAQKSEVVRKTIADENISAANYDFATPLTPEEEPKGEESLEWTKDLEIDAKGKYLSNAVNINLIFAHDPRLKRAFKHNDFDAKKYVFKSLPWRSINGPEPIKNVDYAGVRNYIESIYGISGNLKIDDSMALEFEKQSFHPVRDYLNSLTWDGVARLDSFLIEYFGTVDSPYTREALVKTMCAAVARILNPGTKFDLVLTLVGGQGVGKSTFVKKLGREWFSDTFSTVQGKEALEQIQGAWLIEIAELSGLKKAEVESVKHFISKQEDIFRPAYARSAERYPRQCVFIGTTNNDDFLRDPSGNRRFMPIKINPSNAIKSIFTLSDEEVSHLWAEAVVRYKAGEKLYLSGAAESIATVEQRKHSEQDERTGLILDYLETAVPEGWDEMDIHSRRGYLSDPLIRKGGYDRQIVCVAEIWCECLGKAKEEMDRYKTREINDIMRSIEGWERASSTKTFKPYGKQKYYQRVN